jgi:hypothetical protein
MKDGKSIMPGYGFSERMMGQVEGAAIMFWVLAIFYIVVKYCA